MRYLASHENTTRGTSDFPLELYYVDMLHAQARACLRAVQGRADQDRRQGQRDGEGAELDKTGDYLQDNNNGRHQGQSGQASGLFACSHMKLPPAAAPYLEGCSAIYLPTADSR